MPQLPKWAQGDNTPCAGWQSDGQNGGWSPSFCRPCYEWHQKPFCPTCYSPLGGHCFDAFIMEDKQGSTGMKKINSTKHREEWVRRVHQGLIINVPWDDHTAYDKRPGVILGNPYSNKARKKGLAQAASHHGRSPPFLCVPATQPAQRLLFLQSVAPRVALPSGGPCGRVPVW